MPLVLALERSSREYTKVGFSSAFETRACGLSYEAQSTKSQKKSCDDKEKLWFMSMRLIFDVDFFWSGSGRIAIADSRILGPII